MVSIIIPNYNRSKLLKECLKSLLAQHDIDWEALVVDDGSSDNSLAIVKEFAKTDKRIKWLKRNRLPKGASTCRNIGIENAAGEYIIFLDADDLLAPNCLKQRIEVIANNPEMDFAVFSMGIFYNTPGDTDKVWNIENGQSHLHRFLNLDSVWQTSGPIWKKEALKKIGGFDETLSCWQDVDIHLKALFDNLKYKTFYQLPIDCYYRKHYENTISQSNLNSVEKLKSRQKLYFWALENLKKEKKLLKPMRLNILIGAIKSLQIKFAIGFLFKSKQKYSIKELFFVFTFLVIYPSRLYKITKLSNSLNNAFTSYQPVINVGKHAK
jgi:glycosyltransferase involved in cell wall biosynthesis